MENRLLWKCNKTQKGDEIPMWKIDYCGNTIKLKNVMKFQCGNRLLWKRNKTQKYVEIPRWKRDNYGNAIKLVNGVKFHLRGKRQIFNSVEYSETSVTYCFIIVVYYNVML